MPRLFVYGSLRQPDVQRATFGRTPRSRPDELPGYELSTQQSATQNRTRNARSDSRVRGIVLQLSSAELSAADRYERRAAYLRIEVQLASGTRAWIYVHEATARR